MGRPAARAPSMAASSSSREDSVSIHRTEGFEDLAGRAHTARDNDLATRGICDGPGELCRGAVELAHAVLGLVQLETVARTTEGIGEDDVRSGVYEALVQQLDAVGVVDIPELRCIA